MLMYVDTFDNRRLHWWARVAIPLLLKSAPAWIPYGISAAYSYTHVSPRRVAVWLLVGVLLAGTVGVGYLYTVPVAYDRLWLAGAQIAQTALYVSAAHLLLPRELEN